MLKIEGELGDAKIKYQRDPGSEKKTMWKAAQFKICNGISSQYGVNTLCRRLVIMMW